MRWGTLAKRDQLVLPVAVDGIEFAGLVISEGLTEQSDSDRSCAEIFSRPVTARLAFTYGPARSG